MDDWRSREPFLWDAKLKLCPTTGAMACRNAATVSTRNGVNYGQANAAAPIVAGSRRVFAPKQSKRILNDQAIEAGSTVHNANHAKVSDKTTINFNHAARAGMSTSIIDQGKRRLSNPKRIGKDVGRCQRQIQPHTRLFDFRAYELA